MLEYRDFPTKRAAYYMMYAPAAAYCIYLIEKLISGTLFSYSLDRHTFILGISLGFAALALIMLGLIVDHTKRTDAILIMTSLTPVGIGIMGSILGFPNEYSPMHEYALAISSVCGLGTLLLTWTTQLNRTIVLRFRGRVVSVFLSVMLFIYFVNSLMEYHGFYLTFMEISLLPILALFGVFLAVGFRPWKWNHHPLAVRANIKSYLIPMFMLMAAHILWFHATNMNIRALADLTGDIEYTSLGVHSGLVIYEPIMLMVGVLIAGYLADSRGRKVAFTLAVLLMGMLAILSSAAYGLIPINGSLVLVLNSSALLIGERFVEGFLLGLCVMLIWTEIGAPNHRAKRLAVVWVFFLGYIALFLALQLNAFDWSPPLWVVDYGRELAIVLTLLASSTTANLPVILNREIEMEKLELDFDDKMVEETVDAFVEQDDFDSIRSQLEIIEVAPDLSDKEVTEILGEDFESILPMRKIPGVGAAIEARLRDAGYESAAQLAGETPARLASKVKGLSEKRAEAILEAARLTVKNALNQGSKTKKSKK